MLQLIIGLVIASAALLAMVALVVYILYPCGDEPDHYSRQQSGKGNHCECPLARKYP